MDSEEFERIYDSFCAFHAEFAPDFGRKQWREHGHDYLQGLLVQAEERRNAENLSEALPVSAHALQRFLTDARWEDEAGKSAPAGLPGPAALPPGGGVGGGQQRFSQTGEEVGGGGAPVLRCRGPGRPLPGRRLSGARRSQGPRLGGQAAFSARGVDQPSGAV
jgi:hypothetical protein